MIPIHAVRDRLAGADGLVAGLDAGYAAFEVLLACLGAHEDAGGVPVVPFSLAATCAANGRDAILFAPSLPARPLHPGLAAGPCGHSAAAVGEAAWAAADLGSLLAATLTVVAGQAVSARDRVACQEAARYAQEIHDLMAALAS